MSINSSPKVCSHRSTSVDSYGALELGDFQIEQLIKNRDIADCRGSFPTVASPRTSLNYFSRFVSIISCHLYPLIQLPRQ
jgi:hypothetical protein